MGEIKQYLYNACAVAIERQLEEFVHASAPTIEPKQKGTAKYIPKRCRKKK